MTENSAPEEVRALTSRQFTFIAFAAAPAFMALALVRFSPVPVLGWVLLVAGVVACGLLVVRTLPWFRAETHPALRNLAFITLAYCVGSPVIAILAILFLPE